MAANIAPDRTAKTDGWPGYPGAPEITHEPDIIGTMAAYVVLPRVHRVFSNLKTWALGVTDGLRAKHLQADLHEFVFRCNRRHSRHAALRSLLGIASMAQPVTYQDADRTGAKGRSLCRLIVRKNCKDFVNR